LQSVSCGNLRIIVLPLLFCFVFVSQTDDEHVQADTNHVS